MSSLEYEFIKKRLGPCGLHCGKCFAFAQGDISGLSRQLKEHLGGFGVYAQRFVDMLGETAFLKYQDFYDFLSYLGKASCNGCRADKCKLFINCGVRPCSEEKKVDFCFMCDEFPCGKTAFDEHLYKRHVVINLRMKDIGLAAYYDEVKDIPRY